MMHFHKMNGAGNDFLILNNLQHTLSEDKLPQIARTLCERHLSIGADGLMVVSPATDSGDFRMLFYKRYKDLFHLFLNFLIFSFHLF